MKPHMKVWQQIDENEYVLEAQTVGEALQELHDRVCVIFRKLFYLTEITNLLARAVGCRCARCNERRKES